MKLPLRKCYYAAKISLFLILVVTILALFEQWRGGKRSARAQVYEEDEFEREILEDEARIIPGLGEGGLAARLVGEAKRLGEESEKKLAINVYLSDRIAYNRTLKDYRNPACERVVYDAELPSASVIIIFHNEPYSVVVRTIWSVVNSARRDQPWYSKANFVDRETGRTMTLGSPGQDPSSPFVYLKEIILVDDNSTLPELKGKLSHYIRTRLPPDLIRIIRLPDRVGLTRARLAGARYATGDVMIFLDSHCEGQRDWIRPLLQRIKDSPHAVVIPIIDVIDSSNFYYSVIDPVTFQVGGFTFMGHFTWIDVPEREKKRRGSDIAPTWSPTMAGGLFAMSRQYYWELGAYDEQMAGWGGENLEMSFRIWQCGGTLETVPCSRVGHVFRAFHPYGLPAHTDTHGINTARMAEVWMDEYAELFYLHRPDLRKNPRIGDVTHRKILREKLKCKSFQWYLDNVYREKFVPVRDVFGFGRFSNPSSGLCLDSLQREGEAPPLGVYSCHVRLEPTQHFALSLRGELRDEERCAELQHASRQPVGEVGSTVTRRVLMVACHGHARGQKWRYLPNQQLEHVESRLCLTAGVRAGEDVVAGRCRAGDPLQVWTIDYSELNDFHMQDGVGSNEQEMRLKRLRGQRRISRSLMSYSDNSTTKRAHHKKRKKHKRSKKNKFILKLIRSANGTEEHLEADIYCRHHKLFPNNSFVRDIVSALNDRNIKVINNGRVFEHNHVRAAVGRERLAERVTERLTRHAPERLTQRYTDHTTTTTKQPDFETGDSLRTNKRKVKPELDSGSDPELMEPDKRIIIEDFVEVKKATTAHVYKPPLKKRRLRRRTPTPRTEPTTITAVATAGEWEESLKVEAGSPEDAPLLSADARASSDENWPIHVSYFRNAGSTPVSRHNMIRSNEEATAEHGSRSGEAPVQLVMRSNLTFNLGDELFRWRSGDVANILSDLIIPATTSRVERSSDEDVARKRVRVPASERDGDSDRARAHASDRDSDNNHARPSAKEWDSDRYRERGHASERDSDSDGHASPDRHGHPLLVSSDSSDESD